MVIISNNRVILIKSKRETLSSVSRKYLSQSSKKDHFTSQLHYVLYVDKLADTIIHYDSVSRKYLSYHNPLTKLKTEKTHNNRQLRD